MATQKSATALEYELREGGGTTVVDVRREADFAEWHLEGAEGACLVNVPSDALLADPAGALARAGVGGGPVSVICTRGRISAAAAQALTAAGIPAVSVDGGMIAWSRVLQAGAVEIGTPTRVVQFRREARGCLSYLVASDGEALVVDPAPDVDAYLDEAARQGARITAVLDTHVHADHLSGARLLRDRHGARLHLSRGALARGVADADRVEAVGRDDRIRVGSADVRVVELPGHTTDNVGVLVDGRALIAGDSLFADSVARPDLEVGDAGAADAAAILHATITRRILTLGDEVVLLPCHYAGGRIDGPIAPTLGEVRQAVPMLGLPVDAFVAAALAAMPPRPANYLQIIAANMTGMADDDTPGLEVGANNCATTAAPPA
jgi:glyoxylase-like metal-dependent hydrolase (beta-lactamase superfamily II)